MNSRIDHAPPDQRVSESHEDARAQSLVALLARLEGQLSTSAWPRLTRAEVHALLSSSGVQLQRLLLTASLVRDEGLRRAGRPGVITFSKKVFLPITNMCRDRCHYCTFVESPKQLLRQSKPLYMSKDQILAIARQGAALGCKEALFTLGDRPESRWPEARDWLDRHGYESTIHYVRDMAQLVLEESGLLPHLNPGVMTAAELQLLKPVAPSMGMMLETTSVALWSEKGQAHYGSPDKEPRVRLQVLEDAGAAKIPFTTGILVGIGETLHDRAESLLAIRDVHEKHGHVQEVIVQNFRAKPHTAMWNEPDLNTREYLAAIATARLVMGPDAHIQVPPNLANQTELQLLVNAGIDDWGGVSPLTADHVNPERPWPSIVALQERTEAAGFELRERLTAYPGYLQNPTGWIEPAVMTSVRSLMDARSGLARVVSQPSEHRATHGDRPAAGVGENLSLRHTPRDASAGALLVGAIEKSMQSPETLDEEDFTILLGARGDKLTALAHAADQARRYSVGETITVVANGTIDLNGFAPEQSVESALAEIETSAVEWQARGATEVCVQGTVPLAWGANAYLRVARAVKSAAPGIHLHAFRPADVVDGAQRMGVPLDEYLNLMRDAGVDTIPGTGVKMLDEKHRRAVAPNDLATGSWVSTVLAAHRAGLRSTAVIVYGLGESAEIRVRHLQSLVRMQTETAGFTELVVMPPPSGWMPLDPDRSALDEHRAMHAVARLAVGGSIRHVQTGWPRLGIDVATDMLQCGADDLGGTLFARPGHDEVELTAANIRDIERKLGRQTRVRTTLYGVPEVGGKLRW